MPSIKIDEIEYELDSLSEEAKAQLQMLQATEQEVQRLQIQLNIAQTARNAYSKAVKQNLPAPLEQVMEQGGTIKFN